MLSQMGVVYDVTSNALEAFNNFVSRQDYDIILMDCQMPTLDGFEATKRIRAFEAGLDSGHASKAPVVIVALTAGESSDELSRCFAAGMNEVVTKPYSFDMLFDVLRKYSISPPKFHRGVVEANSPLQVSSEAAGGALISMEAHGQILDFSVLDKITALERRSGSSILVVLLAEFERMFSEHVASLKIALGDKDLVSIKYSAHALRSVAANLGAIEVVFVLREIEKSSVSQCFSDIEYYLQSIDDRMFSYLDAIHKYLDVEASSDSIAE